MIVAGGKSRTAQTLKEVSAIPTNQNSSESDMSFEGVAEFTESELAKQEEQD